MRDVVERAKDSLNNYDYAHAYGCDPQYPVELIRALVAEVEKLRQWLNEECNAAANAEAALRTAERLT